MAKSFTVLSRWPWICTICAFIQDEIRIGISLHHLKCFLSTIEVISFTLFSNFMFIFLLLYFKFSFIQLIMLFVFKWKSSKSAFIPMYWNSSPLLSDYTVMRGMGTSGNVEYRCWPSYSQQGCVLSVYSPKEAAHICNSHSQCNSFSLTGQTTWTGQWRHICNFKLYLYLHLDGKFWFWFKPFFFKSK